MQLPDDSLYVVRPPALPVVAWFALVVGIAITTLGGVLMYLNGAKWGPLCPILVFTITSWSLVTRSRARAVISGQRLHVVNKYRKLTINRDDALSAAIAVPSLSEVVHQTIPVGAQIYLRMRDGRRIFLAVTAGSLNRERRDELVQSFCRWLEGRQFELD